MSVVGYSIYKSFRSKKPISKKSVLTKEKIKIDKKTPVSPTETEHKFIVKEPKKENKGFGFLSRKEKVPPKNRSSIPSAPSLEIENKFNEFVTKEEKNILSDGDINHELLGKRVAPPVIKPKQNSKIQLFSKKKDGIPQEKKPFSLSHLYQPKETEEEIKNREKHLKEELAAVKTIDEDLNSFKNRFNYTEKQDTKNKLPPIEIKKERDIQPPRVEFKSPEEMRRDLEELKSTLQDENKLQSLDQKEIESLRSDISKTLEEIENRQNSMTIKEEQFEVHEQPSNIKLMDRKELDEFQNKIINEINQLETKKYIETEEEAMKEVKGRLVPKNVNLELPSSVEKAYKEYKQKKNNGAPENPFNNEGNGSGKKNNSWTNNFKYNNTSPEIPSSIKELLDKKPSDTYVSTYSPTPEIKEVIKGKKTDNGHRFFAGNSSSIPDPKEVIKGKKKDNTQ